MAGLIQQDSFTDFYPWYTMGYAAYQPLMSDASPQAALQPNPLANKKILSFPGMGAAAGSPSAMSTVVWSIGLVAAALILMHVAAEA